MRRRAALTALAAATFLASLAPGPAAADDTLTIGVIATLSGTGGSLGQAMVDGFKLAVNRAGGKFAGRTVNLVIEDDQMRPDVAVQLVRKMLEQDKVDLFAAFTYSNVMLAIDKPIVDSKSIVIAANAGPSELAGPGCSPYVFYTGVQTEQLPDAIGRYLTMKKVSDLYFMGPNYQASRDFNAGLKRGYKGAFKSEIYTTLNQLDYAAELTQLRLAHPGAVFAFYPGSMGVNYIKQYAQAGLKQTTPLYTVGTVDGATLPAMGDAAVGSISAASWTPDLKYPASKTFTEAFEKAYNYIPSQWSAYAYDASLLIQAALVKVKGDTANKPRLIEALDTARFPSVRGDVQFSSNHFLVQNLYMVSFEKDAQGRYTSVSHEDIVPNAQNAYIDACKMPSP